MSKQIKTIFAWFFLILFIFLLIISFKIIKTDFRYAHQSSMVYQQPFSWSKYFISVETKKFFISFFGDNKLGLPKVHLNISEDSQNKLLSKTPNSAKEWVDGIIATKNFGNEKIRLRYVGDNPRNWLMEKKSFRIRRKGVESLGSRKFYEYSPFIIEELISAKIAKELKILVSNYKLVELFVNKKSKGVYLEKERLNENFLYRNKIMPINLYKGENHAVEKFIGIDENLYNNSGLWRKISYSNLENEIDNSDLTRFLNLLSSSELKEDSYNDLREYIDTEYWSKFSIYDTLTQNISHEYFHNTRLAFDPWTGYALPIVKSPSIQKDFDEKIIIDSSTNDVTALLNRSSNYNNERYKILYEIVKNDQFFKKIFLYIDNLQNELKISLERDPELSKNEQINKIDFYKSYLESNRNKIKQALEAKPDSYWENKGNNFNVHLRGLVPMSKIEVHFSSKPPSWIFLDENYDGEFNESEKKFYLKNKQFIELPITLFANRLKKNERKAFMYFDKKIINSNTKFKFITSNNSQPNQIFINNPFTKRKFLVSTKKMDSIIANKLNTPIFDKQENEFLILSKEVNVDENLVFNKPVKIEPGTVFLINENKHIVFKNKVLAKGTSEKPIIFKEKKTSKPWGSIVLLNRKTSDSHFSNINFIGGSGGNFKQYKFMSMLSFHNTKNIILENVNFYKKHLIYNKMMNIVYCENIKLNNVIFDNSKKDSINISISNNVLKI